MAEQALEGLDSDISPAVPKLGKSRGRERDLGEWWRSFVDEALEPSQRRSFITRRIDVREAVTHFAKNVAKADPFAVGRSFALVRQFAI